MRLLKHLLWMGCTAGALMFVAPSEKVQADDYWKDYWHWYDGSYRPYYYRHSYYPAYGYGYYDASPRYGYYNRYPNNVGPYWGYQYYDGYYGPRTAVQIGPLRFGWR